MKHEQSKNPAATLYGAVTCSKPTTTAVYSNRGGKSTLAIDAKVEIPALGMTVSASLWGRMTRSEGGDETIVFEASLPKNVTIADRDSEEYRAFTDHVEGAASVWAGFAEATDKAVARLRGEKTAAKKTVRLVYRDRPAVAEPEAPKA